MMADAAAARFPGERRNDETYPLRRDIVHVNS